MHTALQTTPSPRPQTTIKVSVDVRDAINQLAHERGVSASEIVEGLHDFYRARTHYNFDLEAADFVLELRNLDMSLGVSATMLGSLNDALRRLIELQESGIIEVADLLKKRLGNSGLGNQWRSTEAAR